MTEMDLTGRRWPIYFSGNVSLLHPTRRWCRLRAPLLPRTGCEVDEGFMTDEKVQSILLLVASTTAGLLLPLSPGTYVIKMLMVDAQLG
jgi:hypothetical protein